MQDTPPSPQQPPVGSTPQLVDSATAQRWSEAVRYVEQFSRGGAKFAAKRQARPWSNPAAWAKTTSTVSARSSATYGSGSAKLQNDSGSAFTDDGDTITVYNGTDKVIASGAYVLVVWTLDKWWAAVPGSCSNLS